MTLDQENIKAARFSKPSVLVDALNAACSAAASGILTEIVFYGLDSYKVVKQMGEKVKFSRLFKGALPIAVLGAGPSYSSFFLFYNPIRNILSEKLGPGSESVSVLLSSIIAGVPSSVIYVPADVVKKQLLVNSSASASSSTATGTSTLGVVKQVYRTSGFTGLFLGWQANILRDVPFMVIKMSLYEGIARAYLKYKHKYYSHTSTSTSSRTPSPVSESVGSLGSGDSTNSTNSTYSNSSDSNIVNADSLSSIEASGVGFISGNLTGIVTCPIDCVNTRIKSGELAHMGVVRAHIEIIKRDGATALFRGLIPRCAILGLGSTLFWYLQASFMRKLSGSNIGHH
mmetsp:Transcript_79067/g.155115  ORF Transcript_79067/g.155115 Transcript_79067/m.155115 type:complete len:343 (-) Transcript_79067:11-1039(-)